MATQQQLAPCPDSPNCISSLADPDSSKYIPPIAISGTKQPLPEIAALLSDWPEIDIVEQTETYLHATFTSRWLRFIDDLEFQHEPKTLMVHVRSASRTGYWDFGANRRRVERIRASLASTH